MELYNKKYVYFEWDDKLEGKKGFFANTINELKSKVKSGFELLECHFSNNPMSFDFSNSMSDTAYQFFYYDPYYEIRKAYLEGKQIQYHSVNEIWIDIEHVPLFNSSPDEYRIKPPKMYYAIWNANNIYCDVDVEDKSKVLFASYAKEDVDDFIETHQYLHEVIKGWFEGKTVQFRCIDSGEVESWNTMKFDGDLMGWDFIDYEYRIEPSEDKYVPFDTVQELIDCWDNKYPQNKSRLKGTMPLIWIKCKEKNRVYLITDFLFEKAYDCDVGTEYENIKLKELFNDYTFLDGTVIGKVAK